MKELAPPSSEALSHASSPSEELLSDIELGRWPLVKFWPKGLRLVSALFRC